MALDRRRLAEGMLRQFAYNAPSGVVSIPAALRDSTHAAWLFSQRFDGKAVLEDLHGYSRRPLHPGRCALFDGIDDHALSLPIAGGVQYPVALGCWVNWDASKIDNSAAFGFGRYLTSTQYVTITSVGDNYQLARRNSTADTVTIPGRLYGTWQHVVAVLPDDHTVRFYIDGVKVYDNDAEAVIDIGTGLFTQALFGVLRTVTPQWYTKGKLFDARLYNRALTDSEVAGWYATTAVSGGRPELYLFPQNLVGHWKLDDGDKTTNWHATIFLDSSGQGHHAAGRNLGSLSDYAGVDVPCSWRNEVGYSKLSSTALGNVFTDIYTPKFPSWTAAGTDGKAVALTGQTWKGRTCYAAKFLNGALASYANNRVTSDNGADRFNFPANEVTTFRADVALSRPLTGSEKIDLYCTGSLSGGIASLGPATVSDEGPEDPREWFEVVGSVAVFPSTGQMFFAIYPSSAPVSGGDLTVYVDNVQYLSSTVVAADGDYIDGAHWPDFIPRSAILPGQDVLGNALQFNGAAPLDAKLLNGMCGLFDGVDDKLTIPTNAIYPKGAEARTITGRMYWDRTAAVGETLVACSETGLTGENFTFGYTATDSGLSLAYSGSRIEVPGWLPYQDWFSYAIRVPAGAVNTSDVELFVNGSKMQLNAVSGGTVALNTGGGVSQPIELRGKAKHSDLRVFNVALTDDEIAALHAEPANNPATLPVGHWPIAEGDGTVGFDCSSTGNDGTITGATLSTFWDKGEPLVHRNIKKGFRVANATGTTRTLNGSGQYWLTSDTADLSAGNVDFFVAGFARLSATSGTNRYLISKWVTGGNQRGYGLRVADATGAWQLLFSPDGIAEATLTFNGVDVRDGAYHLVMAYHDAANDVVGIFVDAGVAQTVSHSTGLFDNTAGFTIGGLNGPSSPWNDSVSLVVIGKPTGTPDWAAIRNRIYNGGNPIAYEDLTAAEKTSFGVKAWYDCDDVEPTMRDKHGTNHIPGVLMPRVPVNDTGVGAADGGTVNAPAGSWHNGAESTIDFTGGVAAPWTDGLSLPTAYAFGDPETAKLKRRRWKQNPAVGWKDDHFYALK